MCEYSIHAESQFVNDKLPNLSLMPADERDQQAEIAYWARRGIRPAWADRYEHSVTASARIERRVAALEAALQEALA